MNWVSFFASLTLIIVIARVSGNDEGDALVAFKLRLNEDPNDVLQSWDSSLSIPCTWFHVTCNGAGSVIRVDLGNANLSGQLDSSATWNICKQTFNLAIYGNNLSGNIPTELGNLKKLVSLDLYQNSLSGPIPDTLGDLQILKFLRLNDNSLTDTIPRSLTTIMSLQILDLSNNKLTGQIPINGSFSTFTNLSFIGNNLSSSPPPRLSPLPETQPPSPPGGNNATKIIALGVAFGAAFLFGAPSLVLAWWRRRPHHHFIDVAGEEDPQFHTGQLKRFSLPELKVATDDFSPVNVLGRGAFGKVYKGRLADGLLVAVKRLKEDRSQGGELQFQTEVELVGMAVHRNLLRLLGFCITPTERLLVYPLMANGSVASWLKDRPESQPPLDWAKRKQIALGAARGVAYLHDYCNPKIIHRDVKAANILLDEGFEAVVGDFGLARIMDYRKTHVTTGVRGTVGHIAPQYFAAGRSSEKTDVFGYGIMLLELVTGQRAYDLARLANNDEVMLLDWVKGLLNERKLELLLDVDLQNNYDENEVEQLIQLALLCTRDSSAERPKMSEVVLMLEGKGLADKWEEWQKEETLRKEFDYNHLLPGGGVALLVPDTTSYLPGDELSAP